MHSFLKATTHSSSNSSNPSRVLLLLNNKHTSRYINFHSRVSLLLNNKHTNRYDSNLNRTLHSYLLKISRFNNNLSGA